MLLLLSESVCFPLLLALFLDLLFTDGDWLLSSSLDDDNDRVLFGDRDDRFFLYVPYFLTIVGLVESTFRGGGGELAWITGTSKLVRKGSSLSSGSEDCSMSAASVGGVSSVRVESKGSLPSSAPSCATWPTSTPSIPSRSSVGILIPSLDISPPWVTLAFFHASTICFPASTRLVCVTSSCISMLRFRSLVSAG